MNLGYVSCRSGIRFDEMFAEDLIPITPDAFLTLNLLKYAAAFMRDNMGASPMTQDGKMNVVLSYEAFEMLSSENKELSASNEPITFSPVSDTIRFNSITNGLPDIFDVGDSHKQAVYELAIIRGAQSQMTVAFKRLVKFDYKSIKGLVKNSGPMQVVGDF